MELKAGYKQTEVGVIPEDWEIRKCSDLSERIMVGIVIRPSQYYTRDGVPALRSANIREDGINDLDLVFISEESNQLLTKSQIREGDVLTVRTGYPGTSAVAEYKHSGSNCIDILITRPSIQVVPRWLCLWINSPYGKEQVLRNQGGLAQKHFNVGDMKNLVVALPQIAEQRAISKTISDVDGSIRSIVVLIDKKSGIKQAAMQELLTGKRRLPGFEGEWVVKRLGDEIRDLEAGVSVRSTTDKEQPSTGRYILKTSAVSQGQFSPIETKEIISCDISRAKTSIKAGDLIISRMNTPALVGECGYSHSDHPNLFLPDRLWRAAYRDPQAVSSRWLSYTLSTQRNRTRIKELATGTSGSMKNISKRPLLDLEIKWPSLDEQNAIAEVFPKWMTI
jgi:restriction endonuclease S subunit